MEHPRILLQLDPDQQASSFDAVVAIDSGIDHLLQYNLVEPADVQELIHGAIFTRGPDQLKNTAIFIGGSDVRRAEALLQQVQSTFFGPMRVSVMIDANGSNTTAAAAVVAAARHLDFAGCKATILAGTGPVGQRVALLLAEAGCNVRVASRSLERATDVCNRVATRIDGTHKSGELTPIVVDSLDDTSGAIADCQLVIAAGAAGIALLPAEVRKASPSLQVAIDLNAVPPLGLEGTEVVDKATERDGVTCYGAIGVGGTKMKIHRYAIQQLFMANDLVLDAREVFAMGCNL